MKDTFQAQMAEARRSQILDAAVAVISEQGFHKTTIKQIARQAGIADGTIYNYFKNKDDILMGIIERITEAEVRDLHFAEAQKIDFERFVTDYVAHRAAEVVAGMPALKVIMAETMFNEALSEKVNREIYEPSFKVAEAYIAHAISKGEIAEMDPVIGSRLFAAPLLGFLFLRLVGDTHVIANWDDYIEAMTRFMLKAYQNGTTPE